MSIASRYQAIRTRVDACAQEAGRNPEDVAVMAVSKTVGLEEVEEAIQAGAHVFGENRPDELLRKQAAFPAEQWHFIGNIQSRRIRDIVSAATLIHSVCKAEHLPRIDNAAAACNKVQRILLEVNVSGEESKSGFAPSEVQAVLQEACTYEHLAVCGLMTMAPRNDEEMVVKTFSGLQELALQLEQCMEEAGTPVALSELSMGMSEDWPYAIAYGSTIVRVGRAIFDDSFE